MPTDCTCAKPLRASDNTTDPSICQRCGGFSCMYAQWGTRCSTAICDCFIETHPDSPMALHPEDFIVTGFQQKGALDAD